MPGHCSALTLNFSVSLEWPNTPASASQMLEQQVCTTTLSLLLSLFFFPYGKKEPPFSKHLGNWKDACLRDTSFNYVSIMGTLKIWNEELKIPYLLKLRTYPIAACTIVKEDENV